MKACTSCLSASQGTCEQRTEPYLKYGKGAAQKVTQDCAKKDMSKSSFAGLGYVQARGARNG